MKDVPSPVSQAKTLLVEDHPIYREGLRMILSFSRVDCEIVAEASNVRQAIDWLEAHPNGIDLAILDYFLPDGNATDILKTLKQLCPEAKVLVITGEVDRIEVRKAVEGQVDGFISKDIQSAEFPKLVASLLGTELDDEESVDEPSEALSKEDRSLTHREVEIVRFCAQGKTAKQIGEELDISPRTVEVHKKNIYKKLDINSNAELMRYAVLNGLV